MSRTRPDQASIIRRLVRVIVALRWVHQTFPPAGQMAQNPPSSRQQNFHRSSLKALMSHFLVITIAILIGSNRLVVLLWKGSLQFLRSQLVGIQGWSMVQIRRHSTGKSSHRINTMGFQHRLIGWTSQRMNFMMWNQTRKIPL